MAKITNSEIVLDKIRKLDSYVQDSLETLNGLRMIKENNEKLNQNLEKRITNAASYENKFFELEKLYEKKLNDANLLINGISEEADRLLVNINNEKKGLEQLESKVTDEIAGAKSILQTSIQQGLDKIEGVETYFENIIKTKTHSIHVQIQSFESQLQTKVQEYFKTFEENIKTGLEKIKGAETHFENIIKINYESIQGRIQGFESQIKNEIQVSFDNFKRKRKEEKENFGKEIIFFKSELEKNINTAKEKLEKEIADFLYKQNALISNLMQQIDSYQRLTNTINGKLELLENEYIELKNKIEKNESEIKRLDANKMNKIFKKNQ